MSTEWILAVLPWLAILACPLVMMVMMRGMGGGGCHTQGKGKEEETGKEEAAANADKEIAALKEQIEQLEAERRTADSWR